tara:strand:+ start:50 stop:361 length:312 start_codon:yes stop_codon:yes gene_type:complete
MKDYENIFSKHSTSSGHVYYNILKTINFPEKLPISVVDDYTVTGALPYTVLSYKLYKTTKLWWLICLVNKIKNPVKLLAPGTKIKIIKPNIVGSILGQIQPLN